MFKETVSNKKKFLYSLIKAPMGLTGQACAQRWSDHVTLADYLLQSLCRLPHCQLLYALDTTGRQLCGNVTRNGIDNVWLGQDLSDRPFFTGDLPFRGMTLSPAYLSQRSMQPCITAIQAVNADGNLLGFIAADFHLNDLPVINTSTLQKMHLQSYQPEKTKAPGNNRKRRTETDLNLDFLIYVLTTMMQEHGIFHAKLDFDGEHCNLWSFQDPHNYRVHSIKQLLSSDLLEQYPTVEFNPRNVIPIEQIPLIFAQLKVLRQTDDNIYLHSGSLNIVNGMVGLTFSHDEPRYLEVNEFLNHDLSDWLGKDPFADKNAIEHSTQN